MPYVTLLIECKRSTHPHVFFKNVIDRDIPKFPKIAGITHKSVTLHEREGNRGCETSAAEVLGLVELPFIASGPPRCSAFARGVSNGEKVKLSGTVPFNSLILPLVKAIDHTSSMYTSDANAQRLYPILILAIGVLDAPMLVVEDPSNASEPAMTPWTRVLRQEAYVEHRWINHRHYVIDAVHIDFFDDFVSNHLMPFIDEFSARAKTQEAILFQGGVVPNLNSWRWDEIQPANKT